MANEIRVSTSGDLLTANILAKELELLLHQKPFALDLMTYRGDVRGSGSDTIKVRQIDQDDIGVVVAEGSSIAGNTALTDASYTITPARIAIKRTFSDLMGIVDSTGLIDEVALARYNFMAIMKGLHALFATATQSLTGTAGTTGVDMSASDFFVAQQALQSRKANGRVICHLHQEQFNNLQTRIRLPTSTRVRTTVARCSSRVPSRTPRARPSRSRCAVVPLPPAASSTPMSI
jgi:hypothetical protein